MNIQKLKSNFLLILSVLIAVLLMYFALKGIEIDKIIQTFINANYFWVLFSAFFGILAYWIRAIRWNILLEPMNYKVSNKNALWAISFGYFMNLGIPRSGEFARATSILKTENIPVEKSFASIMIERLVDLIFMFIFLLLTFITNKKVLILFYNQISNYTSTSNNNIGFIQNILLKYNISDNIFLIIKYIILILFVILVFIIIYIFRNKFKDFILGFLKGIFSILKIKHKIKFLFYSASIWICYFLSAYLMCFALEGTQNFSISEGFLLITAGTLGMLIPTSGGTGSFHISIKMAFVGIFLSLNKNANLGAELGLSYAFLSHTIQLIIMILMGFLSVYFIAINSKK